ncbi:MAG: ATP-NAD kinase family protein [Candidatus Bathyarchaeota archaeon]|nr:ATP-NAD kinase family protein [Candidatus Bathyarchaeota archaeon]
MSTKNQLQIDLKNEKELKTLGFIVNPVAGMGGAVGLKGTDGKDILRKAIELGAKPVAPKRASSFLFELGKLIQNVKLIVGGGDMGEKEALKSGFEYSICSKRKKSTDAKDTIEIATKMLDLDLNLLVFCGGDGTARDIEKAINLSVPVIGVPTGVKMHSAIFALNPQAAATVAAKFLKSELPVKETEVMDVDEKAFREGHLSAHLYGYMLAPYEPLLLQGKKIASPITENELRNQAAISVYIIENMESNVIYILGPGTTTRTIADLLDEKKTLLGVDLFYDKKIIANDVTEKRILNKIKGKHAKILVTPIGGQGFVFGRGNQQISSDVIKKVGLNNIIILATKSKLSGLKQLRIDTGDKELDDLFRENKLKVITDYGIELLVKAE